MNRDKEEFKVDRLALFLDRIAEDSSVKADVPLRWKNRAIQAMHRTCTTLYEQEKKVPQVFEKQPQTLSSAKTGHMRRKGRNHFQLRLFLKRFMNPDATEVECGGDLPPGALLYRLSPRLTNEQKALLKKTWAPCLDEKQNISPAKIFSWLGPAIIAVIKKLKAEDEDKDDEDFDEDEPNFRDVEVTAKFPLIRLVFPPAKPEEEYEEDDTTYYDDDFIDIDTARTEDTSYRSMPKSMTSVSEEEELEIPVETRKPKGAEINYTNTRLTFWAADSQYIVKSPQVAQSACAESNVTSLWTDTDDTNAESGRRPRAEPELLDEYELPIQEESEVDEYGLAVKDEARLKQKTAFKLEDESGVRLEDLNNGNAQSNETFEYDDQHSAPRSPHDSLKSQSIDLGTDDEKDDTQNELVETIELGTETNTYFSGETSRSFYNGTSGSRATSKFTSTGLYSAKTINTTTTSRMGSLRRRKKAKEYKPELPDLPLTVDIIPSVRGYGWPKGVPLQHGLPKQKPYCEGGIKCIAKINKKIDDGYGLWFMDLEDIGEIPSSPSYKDMLHRVGSPSRFWTCSLGPAEEYILKNVKKVCAENDTDITPVFKIIKLILNHENWDIFSPDIINSVIMKSVRRNLVSKPSLKELCVSSLQILQQVAQTRKCPSILQANINIAAGMGAKEGRRVADEIGQLLVKTKKKPAYVLKYIGYPLKEHDEAWRKLLY